MPKAATKHTEENGLESYASSLNDGLKTFGVDTDVMTEAAKEKAADLTDLIANELKNRPLRALGVAAAVGFFVGMMSR